LAPDRVRALLEAVLAAVERSPGTRERQCAATVLGALGTATIPSLRAVIERHAEPHDPLGEVAVLSLGLIGGPDAVAALQQLSQGDQQPLRLLAVQALAGMKTPEARQALEDVPRRDHDTAVGLVVAEALKAAGQGPSLPS
jgi:HEAT repeat protein